MAFLRSVPPFNPPASLRGGGVLLRAPMLADHAQWAELRSESRAFLVPWEPIWPADDLTRIAFRRRIKRYQREIRGGGGYPFFVFSPDGESLLGGLTLSHVQRGVSQSCSLGYWMGRPFAGKGLMSAAVRVALNFAFESLNLHRVEAACLPSNEPSIRLLEKVGFTREGYARRYLCIDGRWQDHLLYGIIRDDRRP
jgi:ribosomal-protein-alanine N-acetyltransferase